MIWKVWLILVNMGIDDVSFPKAYLYWSYEPHRCYLHYPLFRQLIVWNKPTIQMFKTVALESKASILQSKFVWIRWWAGRVRIHHLHKSLWFWIQTLCKYVNGLLFSIFFWSIRSLKDMESPSFISLCNYLILSYFFNILEAITFSVSFAYMAKVVGIGKTVLLNFFNSYRLVSRKFPCTKLLFWSVITTSSPAEPSSMTFASTPIPSFMSRFLHECKITSSMAASEFPFLSMGQSSRLFVWNSCNSWGHRNAGFVKIHTTKKHRYYHLEQLAKSLCILAFLTWQHVWDR